VLGAIPGHTGAGGEGLSLKISLKMRIASLYCFEANATLACFVHTRDMVYMHTMYMYTIYMYTMRMYTMYKMATIV